MQKNSLEILDQQIAKEKKLFNERKFQESQEEIQKAANYISSDILVKLVTLKGFALITNSAEIFTSDAFFLPEAINQSNKKKFEILSEKESSPPAAYIEKLPVNQMAECLKFYNQYSIFNKTQSMMIDMIIDMEKKFYSQTTQEVEKLKIVFNKNDDELMQWMRNGHLAMANSIEYGAAEGAIDAMETGIKTLDLLNKITKNKQTYDFDLKKMRDQVQKRNQLARNELKIFFQTFNFSYPQFKDRIENLDGKKTE
ncbi:hypothetical protein HGB07_04395 [Candidatus Roizmanbacteria bacterium]|nr:hypothetical protein [Candidatus Roizmanbacteria bacterium]